MAVMIRILSLFLLIFTALGHTLQAADLYTFTDEAGQNFYTNTSGNGRRKVSRPFKEAISIPFISSYLHEENYDPIIVSASNHFTIDPDLVRSIIQTESNFNPWSVSPKGASGLMQLMPSTAREMVVSNPFDPKENIYGGVRYLRKLLQRFHQDLSLALAAYNAGPERVASRNEIPKIEETQNFVKKVKTYYEKLKRGHEF